MARMERELEIIVQSGTPLPPYFGVRCDRIYCITLNPALHVKPEIERPQNLFLHWVLPILWPTIRDF